MPQRLEIGLKNVAQAILLTIEVKSGNFDQVYPNRIENDTRAIS